MMKEYFYKITIFIKKNNTKYSMINLVFLANKINIILLY